MTEEEREKLVKQFHEEWKKNPHTGHMSVELLTLPKSNETANKNKDKTGPN